MDTIHRILELVKAKGVNGAKLGADMGLKKSPLTDWKNGKSKSTVDQITFLCEYFAVSTDYLLGNTDNPTPAGAIDPRLEGIEFAFFDDYTTLDEEDKDMIAGLAKKLADNKHNTPPSH